MIAAAGDMTVVMSCGNMSVRSPATVMTSLEPAATVMTGRKVIVTVTPVSDAKYFDKVICQ